MKPIIEVNNVSKSYKIKHQSDLKAEYSTLKDDFANLLKKPFGGDNDQTDETFWALKDISFTVEQGEALGIIGKNGSGKSTLLKILSRIVAPTTGEIHMRGKTASLLEVGTGFHAELTGRENIFFNGSMIGMSRQEIKRKFDEIVAFSEIEKFLDTPVKFYSSGMYVRLAFSVAAHLEPDILILDEVLAVGDAQFQKKCLKKMTSVLKDGRTLLFVSHSMGAVEQLCSRALLLSKGRIKYIGETEFATDKYLSRGMPTVAETSFSEDPKKDAQFLNIQVKNADGNDVEALDLDESWDMHLRYKISEPCKNTIIAVEILNHEGQPIYMTSDVDVLKSLPTQQPGIYEAFVPFHKFHFLPGVYYIRASIQSPGRVVHDVRENYPLRIRQNSKDVRLSYFKGKYMGYLSDKLDWDIKRQELK